MIFAAVFAHVYASYLWEGDGGGALLLVYGNAPLLWHVHVPHYVLKYFTKIE